MAATASIVLKAINLTKQAFNEVATQANSLNKSLNKVGRVFQSIFVVGLIARFVKSLADASTYADQLGNSANKVKSQWRTLAEDIGDAFAPVFKFILSGVERITFGLNKVVEKIRFAAAYYGALAGGADSNEAVKIADETIKAIEKEQSARRKAAEERLQYEERVRKAIEKQNATADEYDRLKAKNDEREKKAREEKMSDEDLLVKKLQEQIDAGNELSMIEQMGMFSWEDALKAEKAREKILELDKEIASIREDIAKAEEQKAQDEKDRQQEAFEEWKDQEKQKLEASKDRIRETTRAEIDALEAQLDAAKENENQLLEASEKLKRMATDDDFRRSEQNRARDEQKENKKFERDLKRAQEKAAKGQQLSEREQLAMAADITKKEADRWQAEQKKLQQDIAKAQADSALKLTNIDKNIVDLLALKE